MLARASLTYGSMLVLDSAFVLALGAIAGSAYGVAPAVVGVLAACLLLLLRGGAALRLGLLLVLLAAGLRGNEAAAQFKSRHDALRSWLGAPERCLVRGEVTASPISRDGTLAFTASVQFGECESGELPPLTLVRLYGGPLGLARGDQFEAIAQLGILQLFRNADLPDPYVSRARQGVTVSGSVLSLQRTEAGVGWGAWVDRARASVRGRIEATFAPKAVGMAKALVLGENDLSEQEDAAFKASGLAHLLAVSGTHLVFAVLSLVIGLRALLVRWSSLAERVDVGRVSAALGLALALAYADFAGGSGSAWRAAWMLAAGLGARALNRHMSPLRAVAMSMLVGWVFDPLLAHDISFALSLAATFGLLTLGRRAARWIEERAWSRPVRLLALGMSATLSATLPCSVLLSALSPRVSLLGVLANVLAAPFGETVALPLCLLHALLEPLPHVEQGAAWVASGALLVVRRLALWTAEQSWLGIELPYLTRWQHGILLLGVLGVHTLFASGRRRAAALTLAAGLCALVTCERFERIAGAGMGQLRFTALDVGQGDAALVDLPDGQLMLVDGGGFVGSPIDPGRTVIVPVLRARRRSHVDVVVISHPHPDHFGGLASVLEQVTVGELWDTGQGEAEGAGPVYSALLDLARDKGVRIRRPAELCGESHLGGTRVDVLGPCPGFEPGLGANDNSLVLRLQHGSRSVLLTGDAEAHQERALVAAGHPLAADVLKVGHHGSRTSSSEAFVRAVAPSVATLSCGMRNGFGHPHPATLRTLADAGVLTLRTDVLGSVTWQSDGQSAWVSHFESAAGRY